MKFKKIYSIPKHTVLHFATTELSDFFLLAFFNIRSLPKCLAQLKQKLVCLIKDLVITTHFHLESCKNGMKVGF